MGIVIIVSVLISGNTLVIESSNAMINGRSSGTDLMGDLQVCP